MSGHGGEHEQDMVPALKKDATREIGHTIGLALFAFLYGIFAAAPPTQQTPWVKTGEGHH